MCMISAKCMWSVFGATQWCSYCPEVWYGVLDLQRMSALMITTAA